MTAHNEMVAANSHVIGWVQAGDPGAVGAGKAWIDTSGGASSWVLKIRNVTNTDWEMAGSALIYYDEDTTAPDWGNPNASGTHSIAIGDGSAASGARAFAFAGGNASGGRSFAMGAEVYSNLHGQLAHGSGSNLGDYSQEWSIVVRLAQASHVVNTWYTLYPDGGVVPERVTIRASTVWHFDILIAGTTLNTAQTWTYRIIGVLKRDNANNTTLVTSTVTTVQESDANYDAQVVADNVNEALSIQVRRTGGVDYDVHWTASMRVVESEYN